MSKKLIKIALITTVVLSLIAFGTITTVDWTALEEQEYYHQTLKEAGNINWESDASEIFLAGWAKANFTPQKAAALVGYKPRGNYEFVQDSSYVKSLVISNGDQQLLFLNYELLIVHPFLAKTIENSIKDSGLPIDHIYFTATHTHSGLGGYIPGIMGKVAFGGYDPEVVDLIASKTITAIKIALSQKDTASLYFKNTETRDLVSNRFIESDPVDPYVRQLWIEKKNGQKASLITFAGHPTILSSKYMGLSGDYPHYLTQALEEEHLDFAMFAAGAVGSQRADAGGNEINNVISYAQKLKAVIEKDTIKTPISSGAFKFNQLKVGLRSAHYRISDNFRLRSWLFDALFGDANVHMDLLKIGNLLMISSSAELSGVFMEDWVKLAAKNDLHFILTSFNGGYMGYVTPDIYYNYKYHEVRDMNFYGPYNGRYFDELIKRSILNAAN